LDRLAEYGFDWVWLLSVWQTGLQGQRISRTNPQWRHEFEQTLPDLTDADIAGSGFAIARYRVHSELGGDNALAALRKRLRARGMKLMLDFVPNHTAIDHHWVDEHPDYYLAATEPDWIRSPKNYTRVPSGNGTRLMAHGRDPYFDGWPDTLQLDYSNPATQEAMTTELMRIAEQCDGLRCDMAMLLVPSVFERTWGRKTPSFWPTAIARLRAEHPAFCMMAEVYWNMEWELQQQGFDYTYDKGLYDRLRERQPGTIRKHLQAEIAYQDKLVRFLENHDEPRAATTFPGPVHFAAAAITYLAPGLRFFHQGQLEGYLHRISPHLGRGPHESGNDEIRRFYQRLLALLRQPIFRDGAWQLLNCDPGWSGNDSHEHFVVFGWRGLDADLIIVQVNLSDQPSQCHVRLPYPELDGRRWRLHDALREVGYDWRGDDLRGCGLFLDATPWQVAVYSLQQHT
jgi:glycosidase